MVTEVTMYSKDKSKVKKGRILKVFQSQNEKQAKPQQDKTRDEKQPMNFNFYLVPSTRTVLIFSFGLSSLASTPGSVIVNMRIFDYEVTDCSCTGLVLL